MKTRPSSVLLCVGLICAATQAMADIHVPAGELNDAVESLARQASVNVLYPGNLLDGRKTAGVDGDLPPTEAFGRLLQGTSLVFTEQRGTVLIARAAVPRESASTTTPPAAATECHRVMHASEIQRYCGDAAQWKELQARVGFRCRKDRKKEEICASAAEWLREDVALWRRRMPGYAQNEATDSAMHLQSIAPPTSIPVPMPLPAPAR